MRSSLRKTQVECTRLSSAQCRVNSMINLHESAVSNLDIYVNESNMNAAERIKSGETRIRNVKIPKETSYHLRGNTDARGNYCSGQVRESDRLDSDLPNNISSKPTNY